MESSHLLITPKLLNSLYTEAMVLADEARACFDRDVYVADMKPTVAVAFSCESLRVTTRLMHSIAWLLAQKALHAGEYIEADDEVTVLGYAQASDEFLRDEFPIEAQNIIMASEDLYYRLLRISEGLARASVDYVPEPLLMVERLRQAF